jgi:hypothetical protein
MRSILTAALLVITVLASAQPDRWQQKIKYTMNIDMNVNTNQYNGKQKIDYWNNSPDTLKRVFFHLYFNAFQPHSMMDERSRRQGTIVMRKDRNGNDIADWDPRVKDRILNLQPDQIGYENVTMIKMNGRLQKTKLHETILEILLDKPILPKSKVVFDMEWDAQVPLQIRRSGRDNPNTKVRYTMTQWYPKLCEYDYEGWHPTPYIAREFYGVWGDYDVTINIDKNYMLGGSGYVHNPNQVGFGYEDKNIKVVKPAGEKLKWHFVAPNVHDFAWAADPEYKHIVKKIQNGPTIHVLYNNINNRASEDSQWQRVADAAETVFPFIKKTFGDYPYVQYSFIHGGDGGMEYPNCTMIAGPSLGTVFHEWIHTWYQMQLATNESTLHWMDEGFTDWATNRVEEYYSQQLARKKQTNPDSLRRTDSIGLATMHAGSYAGYFSLAKSGREEPMATHADHFNTNFAYSNASYAKGAVFVEQLGYIVGADVRDRIMLEYYKQWRFKHPNANDFIQVAEKVSNMKLDWYREYMMNSTKTIDYSIDSLYQENSKTRIRLRNLGQFPMPIDVKITYKDGTSEWHYVPMYLMFGEKPIEDGRNKRFVYEPWKWTHLTYEIESNHKLTDVVTVEIDPTMRLADIDRKNNRLELKW